MAYNAIPPIYYGNEAGTQIYMTIQHPVYGDLPFLALADDPVADGAETFVLAEEGAFGPIVSYADSHWWSTLAVNQWQSNTYIVGQLMISPTGVQPPNSTSSEPPATSDGNALYWWSNGSPSDQWVTAWFNPNIYTSASTASAELTKQINAYASEALNYQLRDYTTVEIVTAPSVDNFICADYTLTYGDYKSFIDAQKAEQFAILAAAVNVSDLFTYNPRGWSTAYPQVASGVINTGRGSGAGPLDLNPSYYVSFVSDTLTAPDTELFVPGTNTVIPYDPFLPPPFIFDSSGNCFNPGDYLIQIRRVSDGFIIAEFEVPLNPASENIVF